MIDLFAEIRDLLTALERGGAKYAVAGAVALAVHGVPRATTDIDLLVPADQVEIQGKVIAVVRRLN